jgi:hypothetical protein
MAKVDSSMAGTTKVINGTKLFTTRKKYSSRNESAAKELEEKIKHASKLLNKYQVEISRNEELKRNTMDKLDAVCLYNCSINT